MSSLDHQFWKPDNAPAKRKSAKRKRNKNRKARNKQSNQVIRDNLIKKFALNKYATNWAICLCIHNECGIAIPGNNKHLIRFMADYWSFLTDKSSRRRHNFMSSDDFYASKKWRELRFIALRLSGGTCTLCGARASDGVQLHVDHIKPRSTNPELQFDLDNLQILCDDCNMGKSNYDSTDFR